MDKRIKKILDSQISQQRADQDGFTDVELLNSTKVLPKNVVNRVVDLGERFDDERQRSDFYRMIGTINPTISNPLFDLSGDRSWSTFDNIELRDNSYPPNGVADIDYFESVDQNLDEQNGWFGYFNDNLTATTNNCQFIRMTPERDEFTFNVLGNEEKNWDLTLTYPYSAMTGYVVDNGVLIIDDFQVDVGGRTLVAFATPIRHNLSGGDKVKLSGLTPSSLDGEYRVERVGNDNGDRKEYYFSVDIPFGDLNDSSNARMKRMVSGFESDYYYRIFKKIRTKDSDQVGNNDYEIFKPAFPRTFYNDDVVQFIFNEDIDASDLRDNLGRPISEVYLTIIKKDNKGFTKVRSGFEMPYLFGVTESDDSLPHIHRITNSGNTHDFLEDNISIDDDEFIGDVVEYNVAELRETTLSEAAHRFNRTTRFNGNTISKGSNDDIQLGPRIEGYYYLPHHLYRIRNFSTYIEQGGDNTFGIPDYAEDLGDGRFIWRDLMDRGFTSGEENSTDYPFLNGVHYLHSLLVFNLRRQDPFGLFGLRTDEDPRINDPFGIRMVDDFDVNRSEDVC